jgi:phytol kinase
MLREAPYVVLIIGAVLIGLWVSNILFDLKVPNYLSRKIGHATGGLGFLLCAYMFPTGWWPLILAFSFVLILWLARLVKPDAFRGVGGSGRESKAMAEVWFPLSAIPVIAIGWVWLNRPFVAISCLLFMAWGDCVTGVVRSQVYGKAVKGLWGSVAMLITCLIISWAFIHPFWIGAIGAIAATIVEWACGDVSKVKWLRWADDNLFIPLISAAIYFGVFR